MPEIAISKIEYAELLAASEKVAAVERLLKASRYVSAKEIAAVLDLDTEEGTNGEF